jgi:hypothetical protein
VIPLSADQAITILKTAERGGGVYTYLEQALEGLGYRYIGGDYRAPEFIADLPVCRYCHQRFMPDYDACYGEGAEENRWQHKAGY